MTERLDIWSVDGTCSSAWVNFCRYLRDDAGLLAAMENSTNWDLTYLRKRDQLLSDFDAWWEKDGYCLKFRSKEGKMFFLMKFS